MRQHLNGRKVARLNYLPSVSLTAYQSEVVGLSNVGHEINSIASELTRSASSVKACIKTVLRKLDAERRRQKKARIARASALQFDRSMQEWSKSVEDGGLDLLLNGEVYPGAAVDGLGVLSQEQAQWIATHHGMDSHFDFNVMTRYGAQFSAKFKCYSRTQYRDVRCSGQNIVGNQAGLHEIGRIYYKGSRIKYEKECFDGLLRPLGG